MQVVLGKAPIKCLPSKVVFHQRGSKGAINGPKHCQKMFSWVIHGRKGSIMGEKSTNRGMKLGQKGQKMGKKAQKMCQLGQF